MKLESVNFVKTLQDYDDSNNQDPMYVWARMYMNQVTALLHMRGQLASIYLSTGEAMRPLLCLQQVRLRTKYT